MYCFVIFLEIFKITLSGYFINVKRARFSYERHFGNFFLRMYFRKKKLLKQHSYKNEHV